MLGGPKFRTMTTQVATFSGAVGYFWDEARESSGSRGDAYIEL